MNLFFNMLRYAGTEEEILLYCLYFPYLFSLGFLLDAAFVLPVIIGIIGSREEI